MLASLYKHAGSPTRLFRWAQELANHDYNIEWHSGKSLEAQLPGALGRTILKAAAPCLQPNSQDGAQHLETASTAPSAQHRHVLELHAGLVAPVTTRRRAAEQATKRLPMHATKQQPRRANAPAPQLAVHKLVCRATKSRKTKGWRARWAGQPPDQDSYETDCHLRKQLGTDRFKLLCQQADPGNELPDIRSRYKKWREDPDWQPTQNAPIYRRPFPAARELPDLPFELHDALSIDDILAAQEHDPDVRAMKACLLHDEAGHLSRQQVAYAKGCCQGARGMLCKRSTPTLGPQAGVSQVVPVLPQRLLSRAIAFGHDLARHHGQSATIWHYLQHFHVFNIRAQVRHHVASCELCQRADATMRDAPYGHMPATTFPGRVGIDFVGHFSEDASGNSDICMLVDSCTKWVVAVPTQ